MSTSLASTPLQFLVGGRTYTCRVEQSGGAPASPWWWVDVSGDQARYAPFRADAGDTEDSVRDRVVAYYEGLLERRAAPSSRWGSRPGPEAQAARAARIAKATS